MLTGTGEGAVGEPAVFGPTDHSTESCEPWYWPSNFAIFCLPVMARTIRHTCRLRLPVSTQGCLCCLMPPGSLPSLCPRVGVAHPLNRWHASAQLGLTHTSSVT